MNKKILFIISIVLVSLLFAGGVGYLSYNLINYSGTMEEYDKIEQDKTVTLDKSDQFKNSAVKYSNIPVTEKTYDEGIYSIVEDGVQFISYVEEWDRSMLKDVADEFFRNVHGKEIEYLEMVGLYGEDDYHGDVYDSYDRDFRIPISLYNFLGSKQSFNYTTTCGTIIVDDADYFVDPDYVAYMMSYGYAYHFVEQNLGVRGVEEDAETEYYKLRAEGDDRIKLEEEKFNDMYDNFQWYLVNIAAMDYLYFMSSDTINETLEFYDTKELLNFFLTKSDKELSKISIYYDYCRNATIFENFEMDMPQQVEGLKEYFFSFVEDEAPEYTIIEDFDPNLNINYSPISGTNYKSGKITWDKPFDDKDVVYTLIFLDEYDQIWFIYKTVHGDQEAIANLGYFTQSRYYLETGQHFNFDTGQEFKIVITITFPDGTVLVSDPAEIIYRKGMKEQ
ncbi:MAG: hypothetical protein AB1Z23_10975 [Eubacteriales bacterium]